MEESKNTVYFESDNEFTNFCLSPYAVVKQSEEGAYYVEGEYSDEYLKYIKQGKIFVIKDEDSVVFNRICVSKRVYVQGTGRTTLVQLPVENLEEYWED